MSEPVGVNFEIHLQVRAEGDRFSIVCARCSYVLVSIMFPLMEELKVDTATLLSAAVLAHRHEKPGT